MYFKILDVIQMVNLSCSFSILHMYHIFTYLYLYMLILYMYICIFIFTYVNFHILYIVIFYNVVVIIFKLIDEIW